jgi:hypothetical protein
MHKDQYKDTRIFITASTAYVQILLTTTQNYLNLFYILRLFKLQSYRREMDVKSLDLPSGSKRYSGHVETEVTKVRFSGCQNVTRTFRGWTFRQGTLLRA